MRFVSHIQTCPKDHQLTLIKVRLYILYKGIFSPSEHTISIS